MVESRDRVGGRASSVEEDGFIVNTGAIAIEYGGVLEETFRSVGAPFEIRIPEPATKFRIKGKDVDISKGGWGMLISGITKKGAGLLRGLGSARKGELPDERLSTKEWLDGYTRNETVHAIFRNLCAAIFAVNSDELPARAFLTYFVQKGAFRDFGFSPTGTLGLMQGLADGGRGARRRGLAEQLGRAPAGGERPGHGRARCPGRAHAFGGGRGGGEQRRAGRHGGALRP